MNIFIRSSRDPSKKGKRPPRVLRTQVENQSQRDGLSSNRTLVQPGRIQVWAIRVTSPLQLTKVTFIHHDFVQLGKQHIKTDSE